MSKRAVDLSVAELAALGAKAARLAVQEAQNKGLVVTGVIDIYENDQATSSLAQIHPSGLITLLNQGELSSSGENLEQQRKTSRHRRD
jgi:hypothetical protein